MIKVLAMEYQSCKLSYKPLKCKRFNVPFQKFGHIYITSGWKMASDYVVRTSCQEAQGPELYRRFIVLYSVTYSSHMLS